MGFSTLTELVANLIEWHSLVCFVAKHYQSTSRIEQLVAPSRLMIEDEEITVFRIHSQYLSEEVIAYRLED